MNHITSRVRFAISVIIFALIGTSGLLLNDYVLYVMTLAVIFAILSLGLAVLLGYTGYLSLAQGAFFGVGAYSSAILTTKTEWSFWIALPASTLLAAIVGFVVGLIVFRTRGLYFAIVTLGVGLVSYGLFVSARGITGGTGGFVGVPGVGPLFGLTFETPLNLLLLAMALLWITFQAATLFVSSSIGSDCQAVREDLMLAESLGINAARARMAAFVFASAAAGLAGSFFAAFTHFIAPETFGVLTTGFQIVVMVVVGGMGTLWGPMIAAAVLVGIPEVLRAVNRFSLLAYGVVLLCVVLFAPRGISGLVSEAFRRTKRTVQPLAKRKFSNSIPEQGGEEP